MTKDVRDIESTMHVKLIDEKRYHQLKVLSAFEGLQDESKQKSVASTVYDFAM